MFFPYLTLWLVSLENNNEKDYEIQHIIPTSNDKTEIEFDQSHMKLDIQHFLRTEIMIEFERTQINTKKFAEPNSNGIELNKQIRTEFELFYRIFAVLEPNSNY